MFYVYFLKNKLGDRIYIGSTQDVENRLDKHNISNIRPGGEVETLGTANPPCAGAIPAQASSNTCAQVLNKINMPGWRNWYTRKT